jgi:hypothetical protein
MLVSPAALADTTEALNAPRAARQSRGPAPQQLPAAPFPANAAAAGSVLIAPQQVLFSTAAAAGARREHTGGRLAGIARRMFAPSPRAPRRVKRYGYIENAAMARAMERL